MYGTERGKEQWMSAPPTGMKHSLIGEEISPFTELRLLWVLLSSAVVAAFVAVKLGAAVQRTEKRKNRQFLLFLVSGDPLPLLGCFLLVLMPNSGSKQRIPVGKNGTHS